MWTFEVNALRVWLDDIGSHVAGDVENLLVVLDGIAQVNGGLVIFFRISETLFFQLDDTSHQGVVQVEPDLRMIAIIIHVIKPPSYPPDWGEDRCRGMGLVIAIPFHPPLRGD